MKTDYLREFIALAETGNFYTAAETTYTTQPSLSRHIKTLEDDIGTKLFTRNAKKVTLTSAGMLLLPYAKQMVESETAFRNEFKALCAQPEHRLSIGFAPPAPHYGLVEEILRFRSENPDIEVNISEITPALLFQSLQNEEFNFILSYKYPYFNVASVETVPLIHDRLAVVLPTSHALAKKECLTIEELKDEQFILHRKQGSAYEQCMDLFREAGIVPEVKMHVASGRLIVEYVSLGYGISLLEYDRFINILPDNVCLVSLVPHIERNMSLSYKDRTFSEQEQRFFTFLMQQYQT